MAKRKTDQQGRFRGVGFIDQSVDAVQRWWPLMAGTYTLISAYAAKSSALLQQMTWLDAAFIGFVSSLVLTVLTLGLFSAYRIWRMPPVPLRDRPELFEETIFLSDLIGDQQSAVFSKKLTRCLIKGPGTIIFRHNCCLVYCSSDNLTNVVALPVGASTVGSVMFARTDFDQCHFENVAILTSGAERDGIVREMNEMPAKDWTALKWK